MFSSEKEFVYKVIGYLLDKLFGKKQHHYGVKMKLCISRQFVEWVNKLPNFCVGAVSSTAKRPGYRVGGLVMPLSINFTLTFLAAVQLIELSKVPVTLAVPVKQEQMSQSFNHKQQVTELTGAPVTVFVPLPTQSAPVSDVVLNVEGIEYDPRNVIPYEIYINLPPAVVPNPESSYYAGKLALFAYPQGGTFSMDITDVVSQLQNLKLITGDTISVTFVPSKGSGQKVAPQSQRKICFKRVTLTTITSSPP